MLPPGCHEDDERESDGSKCRTYGNDCWGACNEPQECADGYFPWVDEDDCNELYCFPPLDSLDGACACAPERERQCEYVYVRACACAHERQCAVS